MKDIINLRDPVRTEIWERPRAIEHYRGTHEPYKIELIEAIPGDEPLRMYWHGDWQDLCRGPHLQHTGQLPADAFKLMSVAGAYWRGDSDRAMLQRIYGVAFQNKEDLRKYLNMLEEAAKRDHRKLGREMDLFHMQEEAPRPDLLAPPTAGASTPACKTTCAVCNNAAAMSKSTRRKWSTANSGKPRATGRNTKNTCSSSKSTRNMRAKNRSTRSNQ